MKDGSTYSVRTLMKEVKEIVSKARTERPRTTTTPGQ